MSYEPHYLMHEIRGESVRAQIYCSIAGTFVYVLIDRHEHRCASCLKRVRVTG